MCLIFLHIFLGSLEVLATLPAGRDDAEDMLLLAKPDDDPPTLLYEDVSDIDQGTWEFPRENLHLLKRLGAGNFGEVFKGLAYTVVRELGNSPLGIPVAVKLLKGKWTEYDVKTPWKYAFLPCGHLDFMSAVTAQNDEFKAVLIARIHARQTPKLGQETQYSDSTLSSIYWFITCLIILFIYRLNYLLPQSLHSFAFIRLFINSSFSILSICPQRKRMAKQRKILRRSWDSWSLWGHTPTWCPYLDAVQYLVR